MTPAVLDRPRSLFDAPREGAATGGPSPAPAAHTAPAAFDGRGVTLEARLEAAFHAARMEGTAKCPVCHAVMAHVRAGAREAAECGGCGTRLS